MNRAQPGIFGEGTSAHLHLEWTVRDGTSDGALRAALCAALGLAEDAVTVGGVNAVLGFGPDTWRRLSAVHPSELAPFAEVGVAPRHAPSTQRDIWMWVHGSSADTVFENGHDASLALRTVALLDLEQFGFRYRDSRDLTGFIDGTENPPTWEALDVALIPEGQPGAGGSYAITQRWIHDLDRFHAQSVAEQEGVFGRTKTDSVEMDAETKPPTAHIARVVIEEDGEELQIYRRSTPYFGIAERGLYFVAFSAERRRFERMLARMFGTSGDGLHDHLTDFTRPVTGSSWFVPALADLLDAVDVNRG